jgi:hypothetical protein
MGTVIDISATVLRIRGSVADHDALRELIDEIHDTIVIEYDGNGAGAAAAARADG